MRVIRPEITIKDMKKVLREKCCEARQKLWEKERAIHGIRHRRQTIQKND